MIQALPPPEPPPAIIVTAPALPQTAAARAYSADVLDRDALADAPSTGLDQILKGVAGLQLFRRSDARSAHPTSQGVTLRALGGNASSRALLLLDGVPQSDPFGGWISWPAYDPASLEQVRVTRGGGSVVHGPGALAGTIEMTSRLDSGAAGQVEVGSRDGFGGRFHIGTPVGRGAMLVTGRIEGGDGFIPITSATRGPADEPAAYRSRILRAQLALPIGPDVQVQTAASTFRDRRDRGLRFTGNHTDGGDASLRLVGSGPWRWSALGYVQWRDFESSFASLSAGRTAATRVALQDQVPSRGLGGSIEVRPPVGKGMELRLGSDVRHTRGETRELYFYVDGAPTRRRIAGGETFHAGLFAEIGADLGALALSGGARIDRWQIARGRLLEREIAGAVLTSERFDRRSGWLPTARAAALVTVGGGFAVRSAAYLGWRLPTLNELFRPFRAGPDATAANPELDPERLAGAEIGMRYSRGPVGMDATLYTNRLSGAIANVTLGTGPGAFPGVGFVAGEYRQRRNLDAIRVRGLELSGTVRRGPLAGRLGYSFADARVASTGEASALDGLRPAQTPRHMLSAGVEWRHARGKVAVELRHVANQFEDDLNQVSLPRATTVDAFAAWRLSDRLQLVVRGENLLNKLVVAGIGSDGALERATPRSVSIGLRLTAKGMASN